MSDFRAAPDEWQDSVLDQIVDQLAAEGCPFSADAVWQPRFGLDAAAVRHGDIGAAFQRARQRGMIAPVGYQTSRRRSRHGGLQRTWIGAAEQATAA